MNGNIQKLQTIGWVLDCSATKGNERLLLLVLANHADKHGLSCYPGQPTIHSEMYVGSRNTVIDTIERLEAAGNVVVARFESPGKGDSNHYGIVMGDVEGRKRARMNHAADWLAVMDALRDEMTEYQDAGKRVTFSPVPRHLRAAVDELLEDASKSAETAPFDSESDQEKRATRARSLGESGKSAETAPFDSESARDESRTLSTQSARKERDKGAIHTAHESLILNKTPSPSVDLASEEEESKFQKLRQAIVEKDGRPEAYLSGESRERVRRIALSVSASSCDYLVKAIWNSAPVGRQVPSLVDWLEDVVQVPDRPAHVVRADLATLIDTKRRRLSVVVTELDDAGDNDAALVHEADELRNEIHDLENQLDSVPASPTAAAVG